MSRVLPGVLRRRLPTDLDSTVVLLTALILAFLILAPLGFLVFGSIRTKGPGAPNADFTLANWEYVLHGRGLTYLRNSVVIGLLTAAVSIPLGVLMAWLLTRTDVPLRGFFQSLVLLPLLFSALLTTMAWIGLAGPNAGLLNDLLGRILGTDEPILNIYSLPGMVLILSLGYAPYVYLAVRAVLSNMDRDLEDASAVLGGGVAHTARKVTLPLVAPAILGSGLLVFVLSAENFTVPAVLGVQSGFVTVPYGIYQSLGGFPARPGRAAALGLLLLAVSVVGMYFYLRTIRTSAKFATISGKGHRRELHRLTWKGKTAATAFLGLYLLLGIGLPYGMLLYGSLSKYQNEGSTVLGSLTLDYYREAFASPDLRDALTNTLILMGSAATLTVLFGVLTAWISIRGKARGRRMLDYLASTPLMIPGTALGVGMLWTYIYLPIGLYGTIGILVVALVVHLLGHGNRISATALMQMSPELEEAAHVLGASRIRTFFSITLRVLRVPMAIAWILVAIFASVEVSASVFLYTGSSMPMSVLVWLTVQGGVVREGYAVGAILSTLTLVIVTVAQWRLRLLDKLR